MPANQPDMLVPSRLAPLQAPPFSFSRCSSSAASSASISAPLDGLFPWDLACRID